MAGRYSLRFGEVPAAGAASLRQVSNLDASKQAVYLDLATGMPVPLSEAEARTSSAWDIGLRRSEVIINGGVAGPKGVRAVDLDSGRSERVEAVCGMTEASERPRIEGVDAAKLADSQLRWTASELEDAFQEKWFTYGSGQARGMGPAIGTWIVRGADGTSHFQELGDHGHRGRVEGGGRPSLAAAGAHPGDVAQSGLALVSIYETDYQYQTAG